VSGLAARGRRVILDLPPAGEDEGAFELACSVGAVVLVARHGHTQRAQLQALARRFAGRGVRVAGAVVVEVPPERQHPYAGPMPVELLRAEWRRLVHTLSRRTAHA
jgi:Mrp family chromosome partitioning ATPase